MSNKDSFTFSDKLKKSKSLPLSKRIPSKVGADGKAKRTLIQRAQRDLPFIIVAAAALLLLPILSRDSGTGYGTTGNTWTDILDTAPLPGAGDTGIGGPTIAPSGSFRDPLSLILRKGQEDTPAEEPIDHGGDMQSAFQHNDRPQRPTDTYAKGAGRSMRPGALRTPTVPNRLGGSSRMQIGGGGGGAQHALSFGGAGAAGGAPAPRQGVRPVALQPLASAGRGGRSMTGEGYAEALRSLTAMNQGPSKQAIFDAQLGPVDGGAPLGAGMSGFGRGGQIGKGGAPTNNVGYEPKLPWWWDFEKQKLMDMWRIWNLKWQEAASDALLGIASCLIMGNKDYKDPSKLLGARAGDSTFVCESLYDGSKIDVSYLISSTKGESGKEGASGSSTAIALKDVCKENTFREEAGGATGFLKTRAKCLGNWEGIFGGMSNLLGLTRIKYGSTPCVEEGTDRYSFAFNAEKGGKYEPTQRKLARKMKGAGIYVVARDIAKYPPQDEYYDTKTGKVNAANTYKDKDSGQILVAPSIVIYAQLGNELDTIALYDRLTALNSRDGQQYAVTKIVGFVGQDKERGAKGIETADDSIYGLTDKENKEQIGEKAGSLRSEREALASDRNKKEELKAIDAKIADIVNEINAQGKQLTEAEVKALLKNSGRPGRNFKEVTSCRISQRFLGTKIKDLTFQDMSSDEERGVISCDPVYDVRKIPAVALRKNVKFSATITNPGSCVYAVQMEQSNLAQEKEAVVKNIRYFDNSLSREHKEGDANSKTYNENFSIGYSKNAGFGSGSADDEKGGTKANTQTELENYGSGSGYILWITSDTCALSKNIQRGSSVSEQGLTHTQLLEKFGPAEQVVQSCRYMWCEKGDAACEGSEDNDGIDGYCEADGKFYEAKLLGDTLVPFALVNENDDAFKRARNSGNVKPCPPICKLKEEFFKRQNNGDAGDQLGGLSKFPLLSNDNTLCPHCNSNNDDKRKGLPFSECGLDLGDNFDRDKATLKDPSKHDGMIRDFIERCLLAGKRQDVYIDGWTSALGPFTHNESLSSARAATIADYFIGKVKKEYKVDTDEDAAKYIRVEISQMPTGGDFAREIKSFQDKYSDYNTAKQITRGEVENAKNDRNRADDAVKAAWRLIETHYPEYAKDERRQGIKANIDEEEEKLAVLEGKEYDPFDKSYEDIVEKLKGLRQQLENLSSVEEDNRDDSNKPSLESLLDDHRVKTDALNTAQTKLDEALKGTVIIHVRGFGEARESQDINKKNDDQEYRAVFVSLNSGLKFVKGTESGN
jgi:hypothetical protein